MKNSIDKHVISSSPFRVMSILTMLIISLTIGDSFTVSQNKAVKMKSNRLEMAGGRMPMVPFYPG